MSSEPTTPSDAAAPAPITRRQAIERVTALLGGVTLAGGSGLLAACAPKSARLVAAARGTGPFTRADIAFLDEVAETMLPETSTPGAKAAQTGAFMALMVTDCYRAPEQQIFRDGMEQLDAACRKTHGAPFMQATPEQRLAVLERIDREQKAYMDARDAARRRPAAAAGADDPPLHYFRMMKELALLGYFTSEIGYHRAMRYTETPGRFEPCVPYVPGETTWAPHA